MGANLEIVKLEQREYKLFRYLHSGDMNSPKDLMPKKVVLVGAGAIENAWAPLMKVLDENPPIKVDEHLVAQTYHAEHFAPFILANNSFSFRACRNLLLKKARIEQKDLRQHFSEIIKGFNSFRKKICESYQIAQKDGHIKLRKEISHLQTIFNPLTDGVITTNWDECMWALNETFPNLVHLHGRVAFEKSLIFPTELSTDEEVFKGIDFDKICSTQGDQKIKESIRSLLEECTRGDILDHSEVAHSTAVHWLSSAEEVIVWGLGFNLYDAELNSIFSAANHEAEPLKKLTVIDIDPAKAELAARICHFPIEKVSFHNALT